MVWAVFAISGILAAEPTESSRAAFASVEVSFATHAGEGAAGGKRFMRNGCYQVESGGGTGGAGFARDSQAGCHRPIDVAAVFAKLAMLSAEALVREGAAQGAAARGAPARGAPARGLLQEDGEAGTQVALIRPDGSRWVAANDTTKKAIVAAINELPSENQWYAKPPEKAVGAGPQLVVLSVAASSDGGSRRVEGSLASDGRWWCYRSVVGARGVEPKLPEKKPQAVTDAAGRLTRILAGAKPGGRDDDKTSTGKRAGGAEISVEAAWPGQERSPLRPRALAEAAADRFGAQMRALSPACAIAPTSESR